MPVRVGFEASGNYHRVLMYHIGIAGFDLKLVSSVALARTREALHNSWDKNDPKDAQVILHMPQIGAVQIFQDPMVAARLSRTLWLAGQTAVLKKANSFRDKFERYISQDRHNPDLRRKAYTAIAAKMARTIHAVIKSGEPYRPFFEGTSQGGRTPLYRAVEAGS